MKFLMKLIGYVTAFLLACLGSAVVWANEPLSIVPGFSSEVVSNHRYLLDPDQSFSHGSVMKQPGWRDAENDILNFGLGSQAVWIQFPLVNRKPEAARLLLEFAQPLLDRIDVVVKRADADDFHVSVGDALQPSHVVAHGNFLVPIELAPQESAVVLARIYTKTTLQLPMTLWSYPAFIEANYVELTLYGVFFGLLLTIGLYHLLMYLSIKDRNLLYYALTNLSLLGIFLCLRGVPAILFWPDTAQANDLFLLYSIGCAIFFPCFFTRDVLLIPETRPFIAKALNAVAYAALVLMLIVPWVDYHIIIEPILVLAVMALFINAAAHALRYLDGYPPARYVLFAGVFTIFGLSIAVLEKTGGLPSNTFTIATSYLGVAVMTMLYSFALAYRINMDRELRLEAQEEAVAAQQELIASQRKLNEELDQRVHERTKELQIANEQLLHLSTTDALTQLRNRHYFDDAFNKEFSRAFRERTPIAILLLDIDHFKQLNDNYGHQFGDACLRQVGQWIKNIVKRPSDVAARYGGEEFIVLLSNTDLHGAVQVANKIHAAFLKSPVVASGQSAKITVSIGAVSVVPDENSSYESIVKAADELLYKAKENGRNQVMSAEAA